MINFTDFIKIFNGEDNIYGDFAEDFIRSGLKTNDPMIIKSDMFRRGACKEALNTFEELLLKFNNLKEAEENKMKKSEAESILKNIKKYHPAVWKLAKEHPRHIGTSGDVDGCFGYLTQFQLCKIWWDNVASKCTLRKTFRTDRDSYGYKHDVENYARHYDLKESLHCYVADTTLAMFLIYKGLDYKIYKTKQYVYFKLPKSIDVPLNDWQWSEFNC